MKPTKPTEVITPTLVSLRTLLGCNLVSAKETAFTLQSNSDGEPSFTLWGEVASAVDAILDQIKGVE